MDIHVSKKCIKVKVHIYTYEMVCIVDMQRGVGKWVDPSIVRPLEK